MNNDFVFVFESLISEFLFTLQLFVGGTELVGERFSGSGSEILFQKEKKTLKNLAPLAFHADDRLGELHVDIAESLNIENRGIIAKTSQVFQPLPNLSGPQ